MHTSTEQTRDVLDNRLRLKRIFLRTLIVSLVTGTLIAVFVLLFGQFNQTTNRILGTLCVLAVHSAIAMACADALEKRYWPWLSRLALILYSINFIVFVVIIWATSSDDPLMRVTLTTFVLTGYYVLAIPPAALREKGRWPPASFGGLCICLIGFLMVMWAIWCTEFDDEQYARATGVAAVLAFSLSHTCLLGRVRTTPSNIWLVRGTLAFVWMTAGIFSYAILADDFDEFIVRLLGAGAVLDVCGSFTLVILGRLKGVEKIERLQTSEKEIELSCPRCSEWQDVPAGDSKCRSCGLKFRIEIEEPRCAQCGYLLWRLTERRCPECGREF